MIAEATAKQVEVAKADWQAEIPKSFKSDYNRIGIHLKRYRLTKDILGKPRKDGKILTAFKVGQLDDDGKEILYIQDMNGTKTLSYTIKVGDPNYFEFVEDFVKYHDEFIIRPEH